MSGLHNINNMNLAILAAQRSRKRRKDKDQKEEDDKEIIEFLETTPAWQIVAIVAGTILFYFGTAFLVAFLLYKLILFSI